MGRLEKSMSLIRYTFGLECYKTSSLPSNSTDIQTRRHNLQLRVHLHELTGLHSRKTYIMGLYNFVCNTGWPTES